MRAGSALAPVGRRSWAPSRKLLRLASCAKLPEWRRQCESRREGECGVRGATGRYVLHLCAQSWAPVFAVPRLAGEKDEGGR